jgi:hypothetical protein
VDSGQTVGAGANVVRGQVGWSGIGADYSHGVDSTFDVGGRLGFNYGNEGINTGGNTLGLTVQVLLRKQFFEVAGFKVALTFNPGFLMYSPAPGPLCPASPSPSAPRLASR